MVGRLRFPKLFIVKDLPCHVTENIDRGFLLKALSSSTSARAVFGIGPGADTLQMNHDGRRLLY